jgi:prepilin-type N-terminal cleavage/methylation domain-containing protein
MNCLSGFNLPPPLSLSSPGRKAVKGAGVTLLELLIVIVVIGIIVGIGVVTYNGAIEQARAAEAWTVLSNIINAQRRFYLEYSAYTSDLGALDIEVLTSSNFTFSFDNVNLWAIANRTSSAGGRKSYRLNLTGRKESIDGTY